MVKLTCQCCTCVRDPLDPAVVLPRTGTISQATPPRAQTVTLAESGREYEIPETLSGPSRHYHFRLPALVSSEIGLVSMFPFVSNLSCLKAPKIIISELQYGYGPDVCYCELLFMQVLRCFSGYGMLCHEPSTERLIRFMWTGMSEGQDHRVVP